METARRFGICLRESLKSKYPYLRITSVFLASQYNLRSVTSDTISSETARKWLNGISLPSVHRFQVLHEWLGIDNKFIAKYDDLHLNGSLYSTGSNYLGDFDHLTSILSGSKLFEKHQIDFLKKTILTIKSK